MNNNINGSCGDPIKWDCTGCGDDSTTNKCCDAYKLKSFDTCAKGCENQLYKCNPMPKGKPGVSDGCYNFNQNNRMMCTQTGLDCSKQNWCNDIHVLQILTV